MKKQISLRLDEDTLKEFKLKLLNDNSSIQNILEDAISKYLNNELTTHISIDSFKTKEQELLAREKKIKEMEDEIFNTKDRMWREDSSIALRAELRNRLIKINKCIDSEITHFQILIESRPNKPISDLRSTIEITLKKLHATSEILSKLLVNDNIIDIK